MWRSWRWWLCCWCLCCVLPVLVPWPPQSMAEGCNRQLQWEKWPSKTQWEAVRPTDQPREDAHGPVFPTRGPCRSRARHCLERPPPGSDFYALPLPWGALQWRAYAFPAWRVMSIAPAGSPSNSVHLKNRTSRPPSAVGGIGGHWKGGGGYWAWATRHYFSVSLSYSLLTDISLSFFFFQFA